MLSSADILQIADVVLISSCILYFYWAAYGKAHRKMEALVCAAKRQ